MTKKEFMFIDDMPVEINGEKNILELAKKVGIKIPTLCYYSELSIYGACRLCMVENEWGGFVASCSTVPKAGMKVKTNTAKLRKYRKNILELLIANHCGDCTTCRNNGKCKLQDLAIRFNIHGIRFPNTATKHEHDHSSPCIVRNPDKCILCGDCVRVCNEIQNVGAIDFAHRGSNMTISTAFDIPISESTCVGCGQCASACPTGAIIVKNDTTKVWNALADDDTRVTIQIAPAVRVGIGKELEIKDGQNAMGKIVASLRRMGFDEVYDSSTGADLTVVEESKEFLERLQQDDPKPLFTSCCPAWVQFCEKKYPEMLDCVSTCRSPMEMLGSVIHEQNKQNDSKKNFHVAVMPCTAKKHECTREEFKLDQKNPVDAVITTQELIQMIRESGIMFTEIEPEAVDMPLGMSTGAGVIFGVSGGVTEAVLRHLSEDKTKMSLATIAFNGIRGMEEGIKESTVELGGKQLKIAVVSGLRNASKIIKRIKAGEKFDLVEVMACPGGCVCGAGQPFAYFDVKQKRGKGLYKTDKMHPIKHSQDNPLVETLYNGLLKDKAHDLLHVDYKNK